MDSQSEELGHLCLTEPTFALATSAFKYLLLVSKQESGNTTIFTEHIYG